VHCSTPERRATGGHGGISAGSGAAIGRPACTTRTATSGAAVINNGRARRSSRRWWRQTEGHIINVAVGGEHLRKYMDGKNRANKAQAKTSLANGGRTHRSKAARQTACGTIFRFGGAQLSCASLRAACARRGISARQAQRVHRAGLVKAYAPHRASRAGGTPPRIIAAMTSIEKGKSGIKSVDGVAGEIARERRQTNAHIAT